MPSFSTASIILVADYIKTRPSSEAKFVSTLYGLQRQEKLWSLIYYITFGLVSSKREQLRGQIDKMCQRHPKWVKSYRRLLTGEE